MEIKIVFSAVAVLLNCISFYFYTRDILKSSTQPHPYTFFIWCITQGTAAAGVLYGKGGWGSASLIVGTIFLTVTFLLSFKYGTKNITRTDSLSLVFTFFAVLIWWKFNNPLLAVLMVTAIDLVGYFPTFRKTFQEPWSETLSSWAVSALSPVFSVLALSRYSLLTTSYLVMIIMANMIVVTICLIRRPLISRPLPAK